MIILHAQFKDTTLGVGFLSDCINLSKLCSFIIVDGLDLVLGNKRLRMLNANQTTKNF